MFAVFFFFQPAHNQQYPVSNMTSLQTFSLLPILLFTFNFTPCIQRFAKSAAIPDAKNILIGKIVIMSFITIIVIAISRLLTLEDIYILNDQNVDALFYTAGLTDNQVALFGAGLLLSLLTSGAYIGTLTGVVDGIMSFKVANKLAIITYNAIICTVIGAINPNVVKIIANGSMPIIVITVFFIPSMYFLRHGDNVQKTISALVFLSGLAAITTLLF
jgi:serine transporter